MPCTPQMIDAAIERLQSFRLVSFTKSPASTRPGQPVTLTWNIDGGGNATFKLNGIAVPKDGSKVVNPIADTTYRLTVHTGCNVSRNLGSILINVDESSCRFTNIPESIIRSQIITAVDDSLQQYNSGTSNDLSKRTQTQVEVDTNGITIRLRLEASINNFPNPDINVDMRIGVGVGPGNSVSVFYSSFSVDVDWPWWVTAISLGITKIVEEIVEKVIEDKIKKRILTDLQAKINDAARLLPGTLTSIQTIADAIRVRIC